MGSAQIQQFPEDRALLDIFLTDTIRSVSLLSKRGLTIAFPLCSRALLSLKVPRAQNGFLIFHLVLPLDFYLSMDQLSIDPLSFK